jgi:hypothetical protein
MFASSTTSLSVSLRLYAGAFFLESKELSKINMPKNGCHVTEKNVLIWKRTTVAFGPPRPIKLSYSITPP